MDDPDFCVSEREKERKKEEGELSVHVFCTMEFKKSICKVIVTYGAFVILLRQNIYEFLIHYKV